MKIPFRFNYLYTHNYMTYYSMCFISLHFQALETNKPGKYEDGQYSDKIFAQGKNGLGLEKGQAFGEFNLGSSIVLLFEAPSDFEFKVQAGDKIKYGEPIGCYKNKEERTVAADKQLESVERGIGSSKQKSGFINNCLLIQMCLLN